MRPSLRNLFYLVAVSSVLIPASCKDKEEDNAKAKEIPLVLKKDSSTAKKSSASQNAPIINITDSVAPKANVIYIKDSAATSLRLSQKLAQIYGTKLGAVIKQQKLKVTGAPIAWYRTQKAPFFFEAGLPVDKKPTKLAKNVLFKTIGGDSALIAHYYGPYEQTGAAYEALTDWLKGRKKKLKSPAYEIYVTDPVDKKGNLVDPYKVQTDIIFPHN